MSIPPIRPDLSGQILDPATRRGRGAASNRTARFEPRDRIREHDGWDIPEELRQTRTELRHETARSLITYNRSPDLPFDRSINPYRGCEHGCIYCFARPTHAYLGLSPGLDFETRLTLRANAASVLEREIRAAKYKVAPIAIGTNTDPYQPVERDQKVVRACLKVLRDYNHPVAIVTKGTGILRDIDILSDMARKGLVRVGISVTTLDPKIARSMEPRVPAPAKRLEVISKLAGAGIPVRLMMSPIVPGLTDTEIESVLDAAATAGADAASWIMLRLPLEVAPLVQEWLESDFPDRADKILNRIREMHNGALYEPQWGRRMRGTGPYADMIAARFDVAARKLGLDGERAQLRCDLFAHPPRAGDQLALF